MRSRGPAFVMQILIEKAEAGTHLSRQEAESAMEEILSGRAGEDSIVALLSALRAKGESIEELVGFARAMRHHATPIFRDGSRTDELLVDTCGTGGDASGTFNISTTAAFVVAGAGVRGKREQSICHCSFATHSEGRQAGFLSETGSARGEATPVLPNAEPV